MTTSFHTTYKPNRIITVILDSSWKKCVWLSWADIADCVGTYTQHIPTSSPLFFFNFRVCLVCPTKGLPSMWRRWRWGEDDEENIRRSKIYWKAYPFGEMGKIERIYALSSLNQYYEIHLVSSVSVKQIISQLFTRVWGCLFLSVEKQKFLKQIFSLQNFFFFSIFFEYKYCWTGHDEMLTNANFNPCFHRDSGQFRWFIGFSIFI